MLLALLPQVGGILLMVGRSGSSLRPSPPEPSTCLALGAPGLGLLLQFASWLGTVSPSPDSDGRPCPHLISGTSGRPAVRNVGATRRTPPRAAWVSGTPRTSESAA